jgi:HPt (histidine-containing phosphotransfer) domain-containing protein
MANAYQLDIAAISQELRIRPEIYLKIVTSFAQNLTGKMALLNTAVIANDIQQMRVILHEIKGTAGNLRLKDVMVVEAAMHDAVLKGEPQEKISKLFEALNAEVLRLQEHIKTLQPSS